LSEFTLKVCPAYTYTGAYRRRRHWLIAASTIDWSNCALTHRSDVFWVHRRQLFWSGKLTPENSSDAVL